jgi:hypothetical protein
MPPGTLDPTGFASAAILHETSYGAGLLALLAGVVYAFRDTRR